MNVYWDWGLGCCFLLIILFVIWASLPTPLEVVKEELNALNKRYAIILDLISLIDELEGVSINNEGERIFDNIEGLSVDITTSLPERPKLSLMENETIILGSIQHLSLIEPVKPIQYKGGSGGLVGRVAPGVYATIGSHEVKRIELPEEFQIIAEGGTLHITNLRAVYISQTRNLEWIWSSLISHEHDFEKGISIIHVSDRNKGSGIVHPENEEQTTIICFLIDLAICYHNNTLNILRETMENNSEELTREILIKKSEKNTIAAKNAPF